MTMANVHNYLEFYFLKNGHLDQFTKEIDIVTSKWFPNSE